MGLTRGHPFSPPGELMLFPSDRARGAISPEDDPGPPPCPNCGDECAPETLPETRMLRWGCCGHREDIDPYDDPRL